MSNEQAMFNIELHQALEHYGLTGVHPALEMIPPMSTRERAAFRAHVEEHGWLPKHRAPAVTVTVDGLLLDGRERLVASLYVDVDYPNIVRMNYPDPAAFVWGANVVRQHLTPAQQRAYAADVADDGA